MLGNAPMVKGWYMPTVMTKQEYVLEHLQDVTLSNTLIHRTILGKVILGHYNPRLNCKLETGKADTDLVQQTMTKWIKLSKSREDADSFVISLKLSFSLTDYFLQLFTAVWVNQYFFVFNGIIKSRPLQTIPL